MTFDEQKAWLQGFVASLDGLPNEIQWQIIKKRLNDLKSENEKFVEITKYIEKIKVVPVLTQPFAYQPFYDNHISTPPLVSYTTTNTSNVVSLNPYVASSI